MPENTTEKLLKRLAALEADVIYRQPTQAGEEEFRYLPGSRRVLVSAPHGAAHIRNGRLKEEDEYTAAIARYLAEVTGAHALYLRRQSATDSNYDPETEYKRALRTIIRQENIRFVLDLHGASDDHLFGIALGTMNGRSCPEQFPMILEVFGKYGFRQDARGSYRLDVDGRFTGAGGARQETITRFVRDTLGVPSLQIELASHIRVVQVPLDGKLPQVYRGDPELIERTMAALTELVSRL
ncbi:MAG: hypothetical protein HPY59_09995 [Anaerolineae bacterium]|nr:hypothetical protein [Anaerolineae bacterium]